MSFSSTQNPTPFGLFDSDTEFQSEADNMITFVKRKLGDDILSVELTKKQIWACFEEAFCEYGAIVNQYQAKSQIMNFLGASTGSLSGSEQKLPRETLNYVIRLAEPYSIEAGLGGGYHTVSGSITLQQNRQDYDLYQDLLDSSGIPIVSSSLNPEGRRMRIHEIFHFSPSAAYRFFDTTSAINYLNNEFSFESFTPETVFYILPVFEDILRGGQMNISNRVRRSNYSYKVTGTKLRIFPTPTAINPLKLWIRVGFEMNPTIDSPINDPSIEGVSNLSNVPFGNLIYSRINSIGRQWIRQYTLALSKEVLGLIRSKFGSIPIPGADVSLDGGDLKSSAKEEKEKLVTQLKEMLETMTYSKLIETKAAEVENLQKILKSIPMPVGMAIVIG